MSVDVPLSKPVVNLEPFERLLTELGVGDYENELGRVCIWIPTRSRKPDSDRELQFRYKDSSGGFMVSREGERTSIRVASSVPNSSPYIHAKAPTNEKTEAILADLLNHLRGLQPVTVVSGMRESTEDYVNGLLAKDGLEPYTGTPEVNHFYDRP